METVGQLDYQYPNVLGHGHHHLADGLGLGFFPGQVEGDPVQLGNPVGNPGHVFPEHTLHLGEGEVGVFHRVVK